MNNFGDFIPPELKKLAASNEIKVGLVLRVFIKDIKPPKEKRVIVIFVDEENDEIGVVLINSNINFKVLTSELIDLQLIMNKDGNDFLDDQSSVDYTKIFIYQYSETVASILKNSKCILGVAKNEDMTEIKCNLSKSPVLSIVEKVKYGLI